MTNSKLLVGIVFLGVAFGAGSGTGAGAGSGAGGGGGSGGSGGGSGTGGGTGSGGSTGGLSAVTVNGTIVLHGSSLIDIGALYSYFSGATGITGRMDKLVASWGTWPREQVLGQRAHAAYALRHRPEELADRQQRGCVGHP